MAKQPYTEARKRANQKWDAAHKERARYISRRSQARGFIRNFATMEDLQELQELIKERQDFLNGGTD
ncbi:hypothetical protein FEZ41_13750 [Lentilactobacillus parafarraginis]|jgi:ribosomal protein S20|nr:hypothetical protein [Lentilactobacillus parafarraginis]TLQ15465.1 hypothetical protein FEZ41_13750 [Lentilactobacillus parafarraginis]